MPISEDQLSNIQQSEEYKSTVENLKKSGLNQEDNKKTSSSITNNFSQEDLKLVSDLKEAVKPIFEAQKLDKEKSSPDKSRPVEKQIKSRLVTNLRKNASQEIRNLTQIEKGLPGNKDKKISPNELKEYYKSAYRKLKQNVSTINNSLKEDKNINPNEQEALKALAKGIELAMRRINQKFVQNQQQIERELEKVRQIEEHEEKKKKSFGGHIVDQLNKAFDALAAILLPPDWYNKAKENEANIDKTELKTKEVKPEVEKVQEHSESVSKEKKSEVSLDSLGSLSSPAVPNLNAGKVREAIPANYYNQRRQE